MRTALTVHFAVDEFQERQGVRRDKHLKLSSVQLLDFDVPSSVI